MSTPPDNSRRAYEAPRVSTIDARELLETLGPVSCYGGVPTMPLPTQPPSGNRFGGDRV